MCVLGLYECVGMRDAESTSGRVRGRCVIVVASVMTVAACDVVVVVV